MARLLCSPCFYDRDRKRPAENLDAVRCYRATPMCADCHDAAGEAQDARAFALFHGGGHVTLAERMADARAAK